jgi:HlyD family type I secretion membrane fusion protein
MKPGLIQRWVAVIFSPTDVVGISRWTYSVVLMFLVMAGIWMLTAPLASAVIISGTVKVYKNRVILQHPEGGVIEALWVQEGQLVKNNQVLMTLNNPQLESTARSLERQYFSEFLRAQRLQAEMTYPHATFAVTRNPAWDGEQRAMVVTEENLFEARIRNLQTQEQSVRQQIGHVQSELAALSRSLANDHETLARTQELARQGFVSGASALSAEQAINQRQADIARAQQRVSELQQRLPVLQDDFRNASAAEYRSVSERLLELQERLRPAQLAQENLQIKATTDGTIVSLTRLGPGAVLGAKETIAELVPSDRGLILEGSLSPEQVAFIEPGMRARVRINQLAKLGVDDFDGEVKTLSADSVSQGMMGTSAYLVQVDIGDLPESTYSQLKPGMPVEIYVQTGTRTAFQYLSQPISDFLNRAARE